MAQDMIHFHRTPKNKQNMSLNNGQVIVHIQNDLFDNFKGNQPNISKYWALREQTVTIWILDTLSGIQIVTVNSRKAQYLEIFGGLPLELSKGVHIRNKTMASKNWASIVGLLQFPHKQLFCSIKEAFPRKKQWHSTISFFG